MLNFIRRLIAFRVGQSTTKGAARMLGFGRLSMLAGLIGGVRAFRRHRHKHA